MVKEKRRKVEAEPEEEEGLKKLPHHVELDVVEALRRAREELQTIKDSVLEARRETRYIMQTLRPRVVGVTIDRLRPRNIIRRLLGR